jgi:peptidoglycan/LPS O-acetylase OafA/YrhL
MVSGSVAASGTGPEQRLPWVQALRAFAALSVAFTHITHDAIANGGDPAGWLAAANRALPWDAGVDIFFVISGFVIVHASASLFGQAAGPGLFLRRRLARIVPLYWVCTACFLLVLWLSRAAIHGDIGGPGYILASFLFIPWPRPDGMMQPAFGLGWTLNYEMFFYAVFAPFLLLGRGRAVGAAIILLAAFVALNQLRPFTNPQLGYWSSPIILEFCAGMALAQVRAAGVTLPAAARLALPVLALVLLAVFAQAPPQLRIFAWGIPAALLVAAAALAPSSAVPSRAARALARLGDASYALYLVHPFVMRGLSISWHKFHAHSELAGTIYVLAGLAAAQICALAINGLFERRMTVWLRRGADGVKLHEAV